MPASFFTDRSPAFGRDDKPTADEVGEILIAHSASCGLSGNGILIEPALAGDIRVDTPLRWKQNYAAPSGARTINHEHTHSWRCGLPIFRQLRWLINL